jgi:hypothetical protein
MVIKFPRLFTIPDSLGPSSAQTSEGEGFGERVLDRVREAFCGLHGHDNMLQFEQDRMFLRCASCGHESPGWDLDEPRPIVAARGDNRSTARVSRPIDDERRIA